MVKSNCLCTEGWCPYLGKDGVCKSRSELQEELERTFGVFLSPDAALKMSITLQNYFGKKICFEAYTDCIFYQTQARKDGASLE